MEKEKKLERSLKRKTNKNEYFRQNFDSHFFNDECRLSFIIKTLWKETETTKKPSLNNLKLYLSISENISTIKSKAEESIGILQNIFSLRQCKWDFKKELSECVGEFIYIYMAYTDFKNPKVLDLFFGKNKSEDVQIFQYYALDHAIKKDLKSEAFGTFGHGIAMKCLASLGQAENATYLESILTLLITFSSAYPSFFKRIFRECMDIVIGWMTDASQKESTVHFLQSFLQRLSSFWTSDLTLTFNLCTHFIEDMLHYVKALEEMDNKNEGKEEIQMTKSLFRVLDTVIKCLKSPSPVENQYFLEMFDQVLMLCEFFSTTHHCPDTLTLANQCLTSIITKLGSMDLPNQKQELVDYILNQVKVTCISDQSYLISLLQLITVYTDIGSTKLSERYVRGVLQRMSVLPSLCYNSHTEVMPILLATYVTFTNLKSVPLLITAYECILSQLESAMNCLSEDSSNKKNITIFSLLPSARNENEMEVDLSAEDAQTVVLFNICVLSELGLAKSNLIAMYALSPSFFKLFAVHMQPLNLSFMASYPTIHLAILQALYCHSSRHQQFVWKSTLVAEKNSAETTDDNFQTILNILHHLLTSPFISPACKCVAVKWVMELNSMVVSVKVPVVVNALRNLTLLVVYNGYSSNAELSILCCCCLETYMELYQPIPFTILTKCKHLLCVKLSDSDDDVRWAYSLLQQNLPTFLVDEEEEEDDEDLAFITDNTTFNSASDGRRSKKKSIEHLSKMHARVYKHIMSNNLSENFSAVNFATVVSFVLSQSRLLENELPPDWLERQYFMSLSNQSTASSNITSQLVSNNTHLQWYWAVWQCCKYCIDCKLKTSIGFKPQDTFFSFEKTIKKFVSKLTDPAGASVDREGLANGVKDVCLLLEMMEQFEKQLYNAYEGSAFSLPQPSKTSRTFFRTNKVTCRDWISRARSLLITIALPLLPHQAPFITRLSYELLADIKKGKIPMSNLQRVLLPLMRCLIHLRAHHAIRGLIDWCREVCPSEKVWWMEGCVEMAQDRLEDALYSFQNTRLKIINDEINNPNKPLVDFLEMQVTEAYLSLQSYEDVLMWKKKYSSKDLLSSAINDGHLRKLSQLHDWNHMRKLKACTAPKTDMEGDAGVSLRASCEWDVCGVMRDMQSRYADAMSLLFISDEHDVDDATLNNNEFFSLQETYQSIQGCNRVCDVINKATTNHKTATMSSQSEIFSYITSSTLHFFDHSPFYYGSRTQPHKTSKMSFVPPSSRHSTRFQNMHTQHQLKLLNHFQLLNHLARETTPGTCPQLTNIRFCAIKRARKHGNFKLCKDLLTQQADLLLRAHKKEAVGEDKDLMDRLLMLGKEENSKFINSELQLEMQTGKWLYGQGNEKEATDLLVRALSPARFNLCQQQEEAKMTRSKMMLRLVMWLQAENKKTSSLPPSSMDPTAASFHPSSLYSSSSVLSKVKHLLEGHSGGSSTSFQCPGLSVDEGLSEMDRVTRDLLNLSTQHCPTLAKTWQHLALWSYKWGRKALDQANSENFNLTPNEDFSLVHNMAPGYQGEELHKVRKVVGKVHIYGGQSEEGDILGLLQRGSEDEEAVVRLNLLQACPLFHQHPDKVDALVRLWRSVVARVYQHYNTSVKAYFTFLRLCSFSKVADDSTTSTLRLLRLLVKHSWGLQQVLQEGFIDTPTLPWKGIIPQLFSRLNHPGSYVRKCITDLLCRMASEDPAVLIYPAIVAQSSANVKDKKDDTEEDEDDDDEDDEGIKRTVNNCFKDIVNTLINNNPRMVKEVQLLLGELHRITLLWDELWLGVLGHIHNDVLRRVKQMNLEVHELCANGDLSEEEKHHLLTHIHFSNMQPIIFTLESLQQIISQPASTPHEKSFQQRFQSLIHCTITTLKLPPDPNMSELPWNAFKKLLHQLQQQRHKGQQVLQLQRISPLLHKLKSTLIPLPSSSSSSSSSSSFTQNTTLESINATLHILPTKTRPKKLVFVGSDGFRHAYLLKGLEDLHLDERIMQFISVVNNMLQLNPEGKYHARCYSVTPLGAKSGLISWVDGATSVFSLYKRWCAREAQYNQAKQGTTDAEGVVVPRPSDLYYNKLKPLLSQKGIGLEKRESWPESALRQVLQELMHETPSDLLSKELWCQSTSASDWWKINQSYARSTAVMCMVGYIIGLGDRHLDNLLIDLSTGEIIHIDYNVCFEKGRSLKVPEKVPFRMSNNIREALGVTGVEGTFRLSSETVMRVLRRGKETLLTLLEAFVYDPLVDWTSANEAGHTSAFYGGNHPLCSSINSKKVRKALEGKVTQTKFNVKMAQMKNVWIKNKNNLLNSTENLKEKVSKLLQSFEELSKVGEQQQMYKMQSSYLKDAITDPHHPVYTLHKRYLSNCEIDKLKGDLLTQVTNQRDFLAVMLQSHQEAFDWLEHLEENQDERRLLEPFVNGLDEAVIKFLNDAGKADLVSKYQQTFNKLRGAIEDLQVHVKSLFEVLHNYKLLLKQLPAATCLSNLPFDLHSWLTHLTGHFSLQGLDVVRGLRGEQCRLREREMDSFVAFITKCQQHLNHFTYNPWMQQEASPEKASVVAEMTQIQSNMSDVKFMLDLMALETDEAFKSHFDPVLFPPLSRDVLLQVPRRLSTREHLSKLLEALVTNFQENVVALECELQSTNVQIKHRLKWAANSNKNVSAALNRFTETCVENEASFKLISDKHKDLLKHASILHNFELHTSDTFTRNNLISHFNKLLDRTTKFFIYVEGNKHPLERVEELIVRNEDLKMVEKVEEGWLRSGVANLVYQSQKPLKRIPALQEEVNKRKAEVAEKADVVKTDLSQHTNLVTHLKSVFKALTKFEEEEEEEGGEEPRKGEEINSMTDFMDHYNNFTTFFSDFLQTCRESRHLDHAGSQSLFDNFSKLTLFINRIYEYPLIQAENAINNDGKPLKPAKKNIKTEADKKLIDAKTGQSVQQRNTVAVGMWRRVKCKLEGRDEELSEDRRISVAEQVQALIEEATSLKNLALLYEGWTAWV